MQHLPTSSGQHGSQAVLFHIPGSRHWWGSKLESIMPPLTTVWDQVNALPTELCLLDYYSVTFLSCWVSNGTGWVCAILDFSCFELSTWFYLFDPGFFVCGASTFWGRQRVNLSEKFLYKNAWNQENVGLGWGRPAVPAPPKYPSILASYHKPSGVGKYLPPINIAPFYFKNFTKSTSK